MKIGFVTACVTDLERSLAFYTQKLGMKLDYTDGQNWAQFDSGHDISLAIERREPGYQAHGTPMVGRFVGVTLVVEDLGKTYAELGERGVQFVTPPERQHWGGFLAQLKDLDGNVLTLMQEG